MSARAALMNWVGAVLLSVALSGCLQWDRPAQSFCDANPLNAECIDAGLSVGPPGNDGGGGCQPESCYDGDAGTAGVGACHSGTRSCVDGVLGSCTGQVVPHPEACNGEDDDCDGTADEVSDLGTVSCGVGACAVTVNSCVGGSENACIPAAPTAERCANDTDDDCDGITDCSGEPIAILPLLTDGGTVLLSSVASNGSETYVVGTLIGSTNVGGIELTSAASDALVLRMNPEDGGVLWARVYGGSGVERGLSISVDSSGNAYVVGDFDGVFDAGAAPALVAAGKDGFVLSLGPDGTVRWAAQVTDSTDGGETQVVNAAAVRVDGKLVIGGTFNGTVRVGSRAVATAGQQDIFIAALDTDGGSTTALRRMGGTGDDTLAALDVNSQSQTYVMTGFSTNFWIDGGTLRNTNGAHDVMIVRLTPGLAYSTQDQFGDVGDDIGAALSVDSAGNVTYAIETDDSLGTGACGTVSAQGAPRPVLVKANFDIACQWAALLPRGSTVTGLSGDNPNAVGRFTGAADFGFGLPFTSKGQTDGFIAQYASDAGAGNDAGTVWARSVGGGGPDSLEAIKRTTAAGWAIGNGGGGFIFHGTALSNGGAFVLELNR